MSSLLSFLLIFSITAAFAAPKKADKLGKTLVTEKKQTGMVFFEAPQDGATVPAKFTVKMGLMGYQLKPAGDKTPQSGHHHILIDTDPIAEGTAIPVGPKHIHFGKAQTETEVELPPGKHTLMLQFADTNHISFGPSMSSSITVTVEEPKKK